MCACVSFSASHLCVSTCGPPGQQEVARSHFLLGHFLHTDVSRGFEMGQKGGEGGGVLRVIAHLLPSQCLEADAATGRLVCCNKPRSPSIGCVQGGGCGTNIHIYT